MEKPMVFARARRALALAPLVLLLAAPAAAQPTQDDVKCIETVNKGTQKTALATNKALANCARDFAKGVLGTDVLTCASAAGNAKIQKAVTKWVEKAAQKCGGVPPPFGPPSIATHPAAAVQASAAVAADLFGTPVDAGLATDDTAHKCQKEIIKIVQKCEHARLGEFNRCKRGGLRGGTITDAATLRDACLGTGQLQPDPKGKINAQCVLKPQTKIASKCVSKGVALDDAFPGCNTTTQNGLTLCVDHRIRCRTCELLNATDGLTRDCDLMDDGNDGNQSCSEPTTCGDGVVDGAEVCDDGGTAPGDGCDSACQVEPGYVCAGQPSACATVCGDGVIAGAEACDDGDAASGDGCSATCQIEPGYSCAGEPSVCSAGCGDGVIAGSETCDDGGTVSGDGCDATCQTETGYQCAGQPSTCNAVCGDGLVRAGETCDDGGTAPGDGCSSTCQVQTGFQCSGEPSACTPICGDGLRVGGEPCDDGGTAPGDGCSATCTIEAGYQCSGQPSTCTPLCGDGLVVSPETCDDGATVSGDGCSSTCQTETGYQCGGAPSTCTAICGDGLVLSPETCDDGGTAAGDGCGATCQSEAGYECTGQPSTCNAVCGDGLVRGGETCDDGDTAAGDGCGMTCQTESGYLCAGQPSVCETVCGDGLLRGAEECDDGDTAPGDGCDGACTVELGFVCIGQPSLCERFGVIITSPENGIFTQASSIEVQGFVTDIPPAQASLTVNGVPVPVAGNGSFSTTVTLDAGDIFNPIRATVVDTVGGGTGHDRVVVIVGDSVADGDFSEESVALRLNDSGLDAIEPLVGDLAGEGLDLAELVPVGTVLVDDECFIDAGVCLGSATVRVINPPPSIADFALAMNSQTNFVEGDIDVFTIRVDVEIDGSGLVPDCDLTLSASSASFDGNYALQPDALMPTQIDVNQIGALDVSFTAFQTTFHGLCDAPIIGDIIQALLPDVEQLTIDAMADFLADPDGAGPLDSPTAEAIETALAGVEITGPIGAGLGVMLEAPLFTVAEDVVGITLGSDSSFTTEVGTGPGQCVPPPGAPDLTASFTVPEAFPSFGATTPVGGLPYDMGICVSTAGFNQLLKAQTECGLLASAISELDLGGGPVPLTASLLTLLMPEFAIFPPLTPFRIELQPTLAPIVSGDPGPGGELGELKIAQVLVSVIQDDGSEAIALLGAFDADIGFDMQFAGGGLSFLLAAPPPTDITVAILVNPLGVDENTLEVFVLPPLIAALLPDLAGSLASFPLPDFLGLSLSGVEVSRNGEFMSLFADLQ